MYLNLGNKKIDIIVANSFFQRFKGLMGKKEISFGMLFPKTNSIHTFFMKDDIDVIALDENNKIINKYENVKKNKIIRINNKIKNTSILELPKNASKNFKINQKLTFISK